jgi:hypothetical protein
MQAWPARPTPSRGVCRGVFNVTYVCNVKGNEKADPCCLPSTVSSLGFSVLIKKSFLVNIHSMYYILCYGEHRLPSHPI